MDGQFYLMVQNDKGGNQNFMEIGKQNVKLYKDKQKGGNYRSYKFEEIW